MIKDSNKCKYQRLFFLLIILSLIISCVDKVTVKEIPLELKKLESNNVISQSPNKEGILMIITPLLWENFEISGLDYRKTDFEKTWSVYEDKENIIVTGTVGRSKTDIEFFTVLIDNGEITFIEIGNDKMGHYPENIIPYSKIKE